jgi:hypothetical protein
MYSRYFPPPRLLTYSTLANKGNQELKKEDIPMLSINRFLLVYNLAGMEFFKHLS